MASGKILLVEDNPENLELAVFLLEESGYSVQTASNIEEFDERISEPPVDLVLLDIHFPGRDGLDLLKDLRGRDGWVSVPVIAVTAHAMRGDRERFLKAGCDGYIAKPIDVATFVEQVRGFLGERS